MPECIGLSLTRLDHEGAFTLAVTNEATAVLDAVQYLEGGPVVAAVEHRRWGETDVSDTLVRDRWPLFARACAASGVQRTHTLPVTMSDVLVGSVHVYAAENAFVGREEDLARLVDVMAQEVVSRSEVSLTTRRLSEQGPRSLRGEGAVNRALGSLAVHLDIDIAAAYERLDDAALRAGITADVLALALMDLQNSAHSDVVR